MTEGDGKQGPANDNDAPGAKPGTEGDAAQRLDAVVPGVQQLDHLLGDIAAIGQDLLDAGSRDHAALRSRMSRAAATGSGLPSGPSGLT